MLKFFKISVTLPVLLLHGLRPASAQNTVLTTSTALPGGGTGSNTVVVGPGNSYPGATTANSNVFIGAGAGTAATTGSENSFVGYQAGYRNTAGIKNSFMGGFAGYNNITGGFNLFAGYQAGYSNTTGRDNSFAGTAAGLNNSTGSNNLFTGSSAGSFNTTGSNNSFMGFQAGYYNTIGSNNSFSGAHAGQNNDTGGYNSFMGYESGYSNTTGGNNSFMGSSAGYGNTTGSNNAFTGYEAGYGNTTGINNSFLGFRAGYVNTTGAFNSFIGTFADATGANKINLQRATALGYNAKVAVNDGMVLGDTSNVKVGIGTAYPTQRFTLRGNINFVAYDNSMMLKNQPFLHFNEHESLALGLGAEIPAGTEKTLVLGSNETSVQIPGLLSTYQPHAGQFLTVDAQGKLILSQPRIQVAKVSEWSDQVFEEDYALRPLNEVEAFVKEHKHLPGVPSAAAMVAEGMEATAFNAKLLEKIEELTLYVVALEKRNMVLEKKVAEIDELRAIVLALKNKEE